MADSVDFARDLITEPANILYTETFVERTREARPVSAAAGRD